MKNGMAEIAGADIARLGNDRDVARVDNGRVSRHNGPIYKDWGDFTESS